MLKKGLADPTILIFFVIQKNVRTTFTFGLISLNYIPTEIQFFKIWRKGCRSLVPMSNLGRLTISYGAIPLFYSPCWFPVNFPFYSSLLTWKPSFAWSDPVHLGPRLLVNWPPLSQPLPIPPHSKFPAPLGFPQQALHLTKTTLRSRLPRSGTIEDGN
jgi:hypothetical protein